MPRRTKKKVLESPPEEAPELLLRWFFKRNGYVRVLNEQRKQDLGDKYRKGWEVRLVAQNETELELIRDALEKTGFKLSKSFPKHIRIIQPVYGKAAVEWFSMAGVEPANDI
jgi:hypothetical protein